VFSNPKEGRETEYNDWYSNVHLHDILAVPGYSSAQRFKCQIRAVGDIRHDWLAIYEMDVETAEEAKKAVDSLSLVEMVISDALERDGLACALIETCGPPVEENPDSMTGPYRLVALTNAAPGRETDFNEWYDDVHMPEVADAPGFTWGERYKARQVVAGEVPNPYFAFYGMEAANLEGAGAALHGLSTSNLTMTDAAGDGGALAIYEAVTERLTARG